jgi:hypothetical protein
MLMIEVDSRRVMVSISSNGDYCCHVESGRFDRALGLWLFWSLVGRQAHVLALGGSCFPAACLPTNTGKRVSTLSPFEPLSISGLCIYTCRSFCSSLSSHSLRLRLNSERAFAFVASSTPSCPGCSCIVGGFWKVQSRVRYSGPVHFVRLHFGLLEHAPSSHRISRDTHTLQDLPTVRVLSPGRDVFSLAAPIRAELCC